MAEPNVLAHSHQTTHPTCIYRCGSGGIHVFYGYVNIGMAPKYFRFFSKVVEDVLGRIQKNDWEGSHVTLHYSTTSLVLSVDEFVAFAEPVREALDALPVEDISALEDAPEDTCVPMIHQYHLN